MGPKSPLALVGGVLGYGLWWLLGLLPFWDLSSYLWYFVGTGGGGLVILSYLAEEGKKALWDFLGWGVFMMSIYALSWGATWVFRDNQDENMPMFLMVGYIALITVGVWVWEIAKGSRENRKMQRMIAESKERTRQRRERRRKGIPTDDLRGKPESGEQP